jgi:hypothetical protein
MRADQTVRGCTPACTLLLRKSRRRHGAASKGVSDDAGLIGELVPGLTDRAARPRTNAHCSASAQRFSS